MNILDLGFFSSIYSLQDRFAARTIDDLLAEVEKAWNEMKSEFFGKVWTTLQSYLERVLLCSGENTYKVPHLGKDKAARAETLISKKLECSQEAWTGGA